MRLTAGYSRIDIDFLGADSTYWQWGIPPAKKADKSNNSP
jgi:hypothetical protein